MSDQFIIDDKASPVLKIEDLAVAYKVRGGEIEAVQNVSFDIRRGESHGIVGESVFLALEPDALVLDRPQRLRKFFVAGMDPVGAKLGTQSAGSAARAAFDGVLPIVLRNRDRASFVSGN